MFDNKNVLLYPLSLLYGTASGLRNFLYTAGLMKSETFSIPVICIGNITMGGTGKTPHTEYITGLLSKEFNVAILSRGYKRKTSDFKIVTPDSTVNDCGDEPLQIAKKFPEVLVAVENRRVKGIRKIMELKPETDVIILDDGFQHRSLTPGFSILLCDYNRPMSEDNFIPYGSLRESRHNMRRADIILITKSPEGLTAIERRLIVSSTDKLPYQNLYFTTIKYQNPVPVFPGQVKEFELNWNSFKENGALLVTGIADPSPLKAYLERIFSKIIHLSFRDHHNFDDTDIMKISKSWKELDTPVKYMITTEKDAMRLRELPGFEDEMKAASFYIPVGVGFLNDDKAEFEKIISEYVRRNKKDRRFSDQQRN